MQLKEIVERLPYGNNFLFVDELLSVDGNGALGSFTYCSHLLFYDSHFKIKPVTPGVILTETMAQIGLVCFGIFLLKDELENNKTSFAMTSNTVDFIKPVYPGTKVWVESQKIYFRFGKLSCRVTMKDEAGQTLCKGTISGMLISDSNG